MHGGSCVVLRRGDQVFCGVGAVTWRQYISYYIYPSFVISSFEIGNLVGFITNIS